MKNKVYDRFNPDPYHTHMKVLQRVVSGSSVLEIGCASGYFSQKLQEKNCKVIAIEKNKQSSVTCQKETKVKVLNIDVLEIEKYLKKNKFDYIILADVLEHLEDPYLALIILKKYLKKEGKMIISVPNIANFTIRLNLLWGNFNYQKWGIMDKTHLHFFTNKTARKLFSQVKLKVIGFDLVAGFETCSFYRRTIGYLTFRFSFLRRFEYLLTKMFPYLLALEFIYELKKK